MVARAGVGVASAVTFRIWWLPDSTVTISSRPVADGRSVVRKWRRGRSRRSDSRQLRSADCVANGRCRIQQDRDHDHAAAARSVGVSQRFVFKSASSPSASLPLDSNPLSVHGGIERPERVLAQRSCPRRHRYKDVGSPVGCNRTLSGEGKGGARFVGNHRGGREDYDRGGPDGLRHSHAPCADKGRRGACSI